MFFLSIVAVTTTEVPGDMEGWWEDLQEECRLMNFDSAQAKVRISKIQKLEDVMFVMVHGVLFSHACVVVVMRSSLANSLVPYSEDRALNFHDCQGSFLVPSLHSTLSSQVRVTAELVLWLGAFAYIGAALREARFLGLKMFIENLSTVPSR